MTITPRDGPGIPAGFPLYDPASRLGGLGSYAEFRPPPEVDRWVDRLWCYRAVPSATEHLVLPHVATSLCVRYSIAPSGGPVNVEVLLIGPVRTPRVFVPQPGVVMEAVELKPEWGASLLNADPMEHEDRLDACALPPTCRRRVERLAVRSLGDHGAAIPGLLAWIEERARGISADPLGWLAAAALERMRALAGHREARLGALAVAFGVSERHLRRAIVGRAGMAPAYLNRVLRLNRVVADADRLAKPAWAGLAARHGFYDQAHLIRDVRELTGRTPAALHAERRAEDVRFFQSTRGRLA